MVFERQNTLAHQQEQISNFSSVDVQTKLEEIVILINHPLQKDQRSRKSVKCSFCSHVHKRFECFKLLTCSNCGFSGCKKCVATDRTFPSGQVAKVCTHCSKLPTQLELQKKLASAPKRKRKQLKNQRIQTLSNETKSGSAQTTLRGDDIQVKNKEVKIFQNVAVQAGVITTLFEDVQRDSKTNGHSRSNTKRLQELETHLEASLLNEKTLVLKMGNLSKENEILRSSLEEKSKKVSRVLDKLEDSQTKQKQDKHVQSLEVTNTDLKLEIDELRKKISIYELEKKNSSEGSKLKQNQIETLTQEKDKFAKELEMLRSEIEKFGGTKKIEEILAETEEMKGKLGSMILKFPNVTASPTTLPLQINMINKHIQTLMAEQTTLKKENHHAALKQNQLQAQIETFTNNTEQNTENLRNELCDERMSLLHMKKEVDFQKCELEKKDKRICEVEFEKQMAVQYLNASHEVKLREMREVLQREMEKFGKGQRERESLEKMQEEREKEREMERERIRDLESQIKSLQTTSDVSLKSIESSKNKQIEEFENLVERLQKNKRQFSEEIKSQMSRVLRDLEDQKTRNSALRSKQVELEKCLNDCDEKQKQQEEELNKVLAEKSEQQDVVGKLQEELRALSSQSKSLEHECLQKNSEISRLHGEIGERDQEIEKLNCHVRQSAHRTTQDEILRTNQYSTSFEFNDLPTTASENVNMLNSNDPPGEYRMMWKKLKMEQYTLVHTSASNSELQCRIAMLNDEWMLMTFDEKWDSLAKEQRKLRQMRRVSLTQ